MVLEGSSFSLALPPSFCPSLDYRERHKGGEGTVYLLSRGSSGPVTLGRPSCLLPHDVFASVHFKTRSFASLLTLKHLCPV